MSRILCIESGTAVCSVGLSVDGVLVSLRESDSTRNHASELAMYIDEVLDENDLRGDDIDAVAVGSGPGSYTGLRIGAATAKGFAYSLGIPLIVVDSLESLAMLALQEYNVGLVEIEDVGQTMLVPMIDARRMEVYTAGFEIVKGVLERRFETKAEVLSEDSFRELFGQGKELLVFGDGAKKSFEALNEMGKRVRFADINSSARGMAELANEAYERGDFADIAYWEPFYLKDFVVTTAKKKIL